MSTWNRVCLSDVADVAWGDTNTTKKSYTHQGYVAFSATGPDGFLPYFDYEEPGVVVSAIGAQAGKTWYASGNWSCIKNTIRLIPREGKSDARFLYYLTSGGESFPVRGSAQPFIAQTDARSLMIQIPELNVQRRIARVLGALDDLIDTNEGLMRQLDEIAMGLFLEAWDGETWLEIQDLGTITMGQSPPGSALSEDPAGIPFFQGVRDFGVRFPTQRIYTTDSKRSAAAGSILIAVRAPVGQTNIALKDSSIGRGLASLEAHEPSVALRALRATAETWAAHQDTGTVFSSINGNELRKAKVPRVENSQLAKMLKTFDEQYAALHLEVENLRRTRDELLPLLMSGKIRVREAEEVVASVTKESA